MRAHRRAVAVPRGTKAALEYYDIPFGSLPANAGHAAASRSRRWSPFGCSRRTSAAAVVSVGRCLWSASDAELVRGQVPPETQRTYSALHVSLGDA